MDILRKFLKATSRQEPSVMRVCFTEREAVGYRADKTFEEIAAFFDSGGYVYATMPNPSIPDEEIVLQPAFVSRAGLLTSAVFRFTYIEVPVGGYGDVVVHTYNGVVHPGDSRVDIEDRSFPACTCGREPPDV